MQYRIEKLHIADTSYAAQHAAGEALSKKMLSAALGITPESITLLRTKKGKPYVNGYDVHFSVSHSGDHILCAVHEAPIGADIQEILPLREKVLKKVCTPAEIVYIGDDPARFTEVWTRKEAYAKLTGKGLAIGLQNISVADENSLFSTVNGCHVVTKTDAAYIYSIVWE